jgi:hypothetical protein
MKTKGTLLQDIDGRFYFRQYRQDGNFTDYELAASDISITIDDPSVTMRQINEEEGVIDYTDEVLGRS